MKGRFTTLGGFCAFLGGKTLPLISPFHYTLCRLLNVIFIRISHYYVLDGEICHLCVGYFHWRVGGRRCRKGWNEEMRGLKTRTSSTGVINCLHGSGKETVTLSGIILENVSFAAAKLHSHTSAIDRRWPYNLSKSLTFPVLQTCLFYCFIRLSVGFSFYTVFVSHVVAFSRRYNPPLYSFLTWVMKFHTPPTSQ